MSCQIIVNLISILWGNTFLKLNDGIKLVFLVLIDADVAERNAGRTVVEGIHNQADVVFRDLISPIAPCFSQAVRADIFDSKSGRSLFHHLVNLHSAHMAALLAVKQIILPAQALLPDISGNTLAQRLVQLDPFFL